MWFQFFRFYWKGISIPTKSNHFNCHQQWLFGLFLSSLCQKCNHNKYKKKTKTFTSPQSFLIESVPFQVLPKCNTSLFPPRVELKSENTIWKLQLKAYLSNFNCYHKYLTSLKTASSSFLSYVTFLLLLYSFIVIQSVHVYWWKLVAVNCIELHFKMETYIT